MFKLKMPFKILLVGFLSISIAQASSVGTVEACGDKIVLGKRLTANWKKVNETLYSDFEGNEECTAKTDSDKNVMSVLIENKNMYVYVAEYPANIDEILKFKEAQVVLVSRKNGSTIEKRFKNVEDLNRFLKHARNSIFKFAVVKYAGGNNSLSMINICSTTKCSLQRKFSLNK